MSLLLVGDSWAASYAYDTKTYWCLADALGVPEHLRQAVGGSTAQMWSGDFDGRLTKACSTESAAVLVSLLGNDAKERVQSGNTPFDFDRPLAALHTVVKRLTDTHRNVWVMLYANPTPNQDVRAGLIVRMLNTAIWVSCFELPVRFLYTGRALTPDHFVGGDGLHPNEAGWLEVGKIIKNEVMG